MDDQALEEVVDAPEVTDEYSEVEAESAELETTESEEIEEEINEPEDVEVEYEGKQYRVPPELKDALLRESDYTRKTQEVAAQRKELETQAVQFQQSMQVQQANLQNYAQLSAIDAQLKQYSEVNWQRLSEDDPVGAQQAFFQYTQLKDARQGIANQLRQNEQQAIQQQQVQLARRLEEGKQVLRRDIKGWSDDVAKELSSFGVDSYGFTQHEMGSIIDPRMIKVLHDAHQFRKMLAKATTKPKPNIKPVKAVSGKSPTKPSPEKMSTEEWMKWRNKQA